jgi:hypothetical protein
MILPLRYNGISGFEIILKPSSLLMHAEVNCISPSTRSFLNEEEGLFGVN